MIPNQTEVKYPLDINQVRTFLPHRSPFLLVDRILSIQTVGDLKDSSSANKTGVVIEGIKNISYNEGVFTGHFPEFSVYPGVMILETMAQVSVFAIYPYLDFPPEEFTKKYKAFLTGVEDAKFRRQVIPGDTLKIVSKVIRTRGPLWRFECEGFVDGELAAEAEITATMFQVKE